MISGWIAWSSTTRLMAVTGDQIRALKRVYKHSRMQRFLLEFETALGLELSHD